MPLKWTSSALALALLLSAGCGGDEATTSISANQAQPSSFNNRDNSESSGFAPIPNRPPIVVRQSTPAETITSFMEAVLRGDRDLSSSMLTPLARETSTDFAPAGSDTAVYEVGQVTNVGVGIANVACVWTEIGDDGQPRPEYMKWVVKQIDQKWFVSGLIAEMGEGQPPVVLDFEQKEDAVVQPTEPVAPANGTPPVREANGGRDPFQSTPQQ